MGHGLGEITGLVWAGSLPEPDAMRLVAQRDAVLSPAQPQRSGMTCVTADQVAPWCSVLAEFEFGRPGRRLISTITGRELTADDDIAALLGAQLTSPVRFADALNAAADGADLLVEAGPGETLGALAAGCCDVPAVSLATGRRDDETSPRAAAALFAAGAISSLEPLLTGRPARPIDIWRERVFITNPCEAGKDAPAGAGHLAATETAETTATTATAETTKTIETARTTGTASRGRSGSLDPLLRGAPAPAAESRFLG